MAWSLLVATGQSSEYLHAAAMLGVGFLIAGPDGILGGAASKNLCEYNLCEAPEMAPAVSGTVNGLASLGVIAMSKFTSNLALLFTQREKRKIVPRAPKGLRAENWRLLLQFCMMQSPSKNGARGV